MSEPQISIENLSFQYDEKRKILDNISLKIDEKESVGLVGANGVGKSTFLKLLVGLDLNFDGNIMIEKIPVEKKTLSLIRQKIGYVFQDSDSQLFMATAYDDIAFAPRNYGFTAEEVEKRVSHALEMVGIEHLRNRQNFRMSGGEKKLVSIATILSMMPDIILMDEPSIALDPRNRRNLIRILKSFDCLKIVASHDLDFILDTCQRTILMANGTIIADGDTKQILSDKKLLEANGLELPLCMQNKNFAQ